MADPQPLTEEQAAAMRAQLAAHDFQKQLEAVQAENARRVEALGALEEAATAVAGLAGPVEALRTVLTSLPGASLDLATLAQSTVRCFDSLQGRLNRITADLQPAPEPEPPAEPAT
ncbi:hypothetical protein [Brevundimonas sp. GCM10030266]|uniref:hypothetical protein n=1 Tax=Brevundimonas sp. GCM10030266 TaxID=3273386 RepID=UPI003611E9A6